MKGYRYVHAQLDAEAVRNLAMTLCGSPTYLYSQSVTSVSLTVLSPDFTLPGEGRAFGPEAEVRWQQVEPEAEIYQVLVLSETQQILDATWTCTDFDLGAKQNLYLLGVWQPREKAWVEVRLPQPLAYPLENPGKMARAVMPAVEYQQAGIVTYIRLTGLQAEPLQEAQS